jgi:hypothetical protein
VKNFNYLIMVFEAVSITSLLLTHYRKFPVLHFETNVTGNTIKLPNFQLLIFIDTFIISEVENI